MLYRQYHSNSTLRPARLATSVLRTAHIHHDHLNKIYDSLRHQYDAVHMASLSLGHYVLTIAETLPRRRRLNSKDKPFCSLGFKQVDLIRKVKVHSEFLSSNVRKAIEAGGEPRTLGNYVSVVKMKQVAETCVVCSIVVALRN